MSKLDFCPKCGAKQQAQTDFCTSCGADLKAFLGEDFVSELSAEEEPEVEDQGYELAWSDTDDSEPDEDLEIQAAKFNSSKGCWGLLLLGIAFFLIFIFAISYLIGILPQPETIEVVEAEEQPQTKESGQYDQSYESETANGALTDIESAIYREDFVQAITLINEIYSKYPNTTASDKAKKIHEEYEQNINDAVAIYTAKMEKEDEKKRRQAKKALKRMHKKRDEFEGMTWYQDRGSPRYTNINGLYLYFGANDSGSVGELRLVIQYVADDWLWVQNVIVQTGRGKWYLEKILPSDWKRDVVYGKIVERVDVPLGDMKWCIDDIIDSSKATIRFYGKDYHSDRNINATKRKALKNVILAQEALSSEF